MKGLFIAALVGGVLTYKRVSSIINAAEHSSISVAGGKFVKLLSVQQSYIIVRLKITNNTSTTFNLGTFQASLTYQGKEIAQVFYNKNDTVKPGSNYVDVPAFLNNISTFSSVVDLIKSFFGGDLNKQVRLKGYMVKFGVRIPCDETFTLKDIL